LDAAEMSAPFLTKYDRVCVEIQKYHQVAVQSFSELNALYRQDNDDAQALEVVSDIQYTISGIFAILAELLEEGKREKAVDPDVWPAASARVLWVSIFALLDMTWLDKDGLFSDNPASGAKQFLRYGFRQLINSLLIERMRGEEPLGEGDQIS
jgi:hypothetical protein